MINESFQTDGDVRTLASNDAAAFALFGDGASSTQDDTPSSIAPLDEEEMALHVNRLGAAWHPSHNISAGDELEEDGTPTTTTRKTAVADPTKLQQQKKQPQKNDLKITSASSSSSSSSSASSIYYLDNGSSTSSSAKAAETTASSGKWSWGDKYALPAGFSFINHKNNSPPSALQDVSRRLGALWGDCASPTAKNEISNQGGGGGGSRRLVSFWINNKYKDKDEIEANTTMTDPAFSGTPQTVELSPTSTAASSPKMLERSMDEMMQQLSAQLPEKKSSMNAMQWRQSVQLPVDTTTKSKSNKKDDNDSASFGFPVSVHLSENSNSSNNKDKDGGAAASVAGWKSYYDGSTITSAWNTLGSSGGDIRTLQSGEDLSSYHSSSSNNNKNNHSQPTKQVRVPRRHQAEGAPCKGGGHSQSKSKRTSATSSSSKNNNSNNDHRPKWFVCTVAVLLVLILLAIVGATACGLGYCTAHHSSNNNNNDIAPRSETPAGPTKTVPPLRRSTAVPAATTTTYPPETPSPTVSPSTVPTTTEPTLSPSTSTPTPEPTSEPTPSPVPKRVIVWLPWP